MAMDEIFHFEDQEFVSDVVVLRILQELNGKRRNPQYKSISLRSMLYDKYDASMFVHRNLKLDREELARVHCLTAYLRHPTIFRCIILTKIRTMSLVVQLTCRTKLQQIGIMTTESLDIKPDCSQCPDTPNEFAPTLPSVTSFTEEFTDYCGNSSRFQEIILYQSQEANFGDERYDVKDVEIGSEQLNSHSTLKSSEMMPKDAKLETNPLPEATVSSHSNTMHPFQSYSPPFAANITQQSFPDDIVAEVAVFIGYPRSLEKHEIRLGRLRGSTLGFRAKNC
ncbi:hypothetical protein NECAME_13383 [Necator americanus]|uniref:Uncharacterized protein n=1 Tax=Necator americanus TaxID=51031 RepID=W2SVV8_NECAM|nr:hypothetical protein NECAME_13383 [Necator americanus]ETN73874.1 hypothetical protein NECAME_13383 [Necator americanus]